MNLPKTFGLHAGEIQVSHNEVHFDGSTLSSGVTMTPQQGVQGGQVFGCFQRIEIVRLLSECDAGRLELFQGLMVTQSDAAPIITLEQHKRAIEVKAVDGKQRPSVLAELSGDSRHYAAAFELTLRDGRLTPRGTSDVAKFSQPLLDNMLFGAIGLGCVVRRQIF